MAKGNMLLGQAVGSVGDITFSRVNGKQVIRAKAQQVKNPQTDAQLIQRILMNTVIQAYSKMSSICDHSFEGVNSGQDSMSYFMARNLKLIRYQLAVTNDMSAVPPFVAPIGVNGLASNDFIIAKGQLAEITPLVSSGGLQILTEANTYGAVIAATGAKRGDQITFITVSGQDITTQKFIFSRVILDPLDETGEELPLSTPFIVDGNINKAHPKNENNGHEYNFDNGYVEVAPYGSVTNMGAVIASRQKADGSWLRSNAALILADEAGVGYDMESALAMFAAGGIDVENPRYLNNAARARAAKVSENTNNGGNGGGGNSGGGGSNNGGGDNETQTVNAPVISQSGAEEPVTVTITSTTPGVSIHYTTDGSVPTAASPTYSEPFTAATDTVVKAIAVGANASSAVSTYTVQAPSGEEGDMN